MSISGRVAGLDFIKASACGNDCVIFIGCRSEDLGRVSVERVVSVADRAYGVGCDQVIFCRCIGDAEYDVAIYNSDGSRSAVCGNAFRCISHVLANSADGVVLNIRSGTYQFKALLHDGVAFVDMGVPSFYWRDIPISEDVEHIKTKFLGVDICGVPLSIGNPHLVFSFTEPFDGLSIEAFPLGLLASHVELGGLFPEGVNISVCYLDPCGEAVRARVFERGVGETRSCGSAACAIFSVARKMDALNQGKCLEVVFPGGVSRVNLGGESGDRLMLSGEPCKLLFKGTLFDSVLST